MKLYSYVMKYDEGFAPNPYHGYLTLATCKQVIRKVADVGDFIIGTGSKPRGDVGKLIYIMEVSETLTFQEYSADSRFQAKKPVMSNNKVQQVGDNIYHYENGYFNQLNSVHSDKDGNTVEGHKKTDLSGINVLISNNFVYYGNNSKLIPDEFRNCHGQDICIRNSNHKTFDNNNYPKLAEFIQWAYDREPIEAMVMGRPSDWKKT
ncbi:hypothetical protein NK638_07525 [Psychrobacter sp. A3]|uniref:Nmad2 family putative nucleotide modification protein n=1 Tax=Psychrobacter sp. A3 TaxID=2992754 RepID=UPI00237C3064|nr:hypothetical protein [Psychrobacter sp. A3]MDE0491377.1 hypothetical protein [Psychrobacter sp. A3]